MIGFICNVNRISCLNLLLFYENSKFYEWKLKNLIPKSNFTLKRLLNFGEIFHPNQDTIVDSLKIWKSIIYCYQLSDTIVDSLIANHPMIKTRL